jgi:hypothetical protein
MHCTHTTLTLTAHPDTPFRTAATEALRVVQALKQTAVTLHYGSVEMVVLPRSTLGDLEALYARTLASNAWLAADGARQRAALGLGPSATQPYHRVDVLP